MNVQELYQQKLTTAEEAVKIVKSGDWVDYGWCCNQPVALDKALAARKDELFDVKIHGGVTMWMPEVCKADDAGDHFTWNSWHCSGIDRKIISKGMGYFIPMRYSELPRFYRDGNATVDVAMIQVTPMDKHGNFSYALACSHLADMLDAAKTVIVEVNENLPWVYGLTGCEINIKDVDMVVEGENPPVAQLGAGGAPTEVDTAVANLVVPEIPNGACLQLGIGGMPNTIGSMIAQSDLKDLSVHTEMYVDGFVDMALAGKMDGRDYRVYTIMGDGELAEGSVWEGAMSGGNYQLDNLCALVDRNRLQISGSTEDVMKQDSQEERWAAFGWNVLSIPGNDVQAIDAALTLAAETKGKPTVIILNTVKGYGSSVMEDKASWHHHLPNDEEYAQIIADFAAHKEAING